MSDYQPNALEEVNDPMTKLAAWQTLAEPYLASLPMPTAGMPPHRMGVHLIGQSEPNYAFIQALNPAAVKIVDPDPAVVRRVLSTTGPHCMVVLRNHPLSEQKDLMYSNPVGTGTSHAEYWIAQLKTGRFKEFLGNPRVGVVGINEPNAHNPAEHNTLLAYTRTFLRRLTVDKIWALAYNLSVGHPENWDILKLIEPDILANKGFLCVHEYWYPNVQSGWGFYGNRVSKCPMSVPIIIGENGYTRQLANLPQPWGYIGNQSPEQYANDLWYYNDNVDPNVYATMTFTTGFASQDWASKDTGPAHSAILARKHNYTKWPAVWPVRKTPAPPPPPPTPVGDMNLVIFPRLSPITNFFGEIWGNVSHSGLDISAVTGTPIYAPSPGTVVSWVGDDGTAGYGKYIRVSCPAPINIDLLFGHCREIKVPQGKVLSQGELIAYSDNTGNSTGSHIHMELRLKTAGSGQGSYVLGVSSHTNSSVDPFAWIAGWVANGGKVQFK